MIGGTNQLTALSYFATAPTMETVSSFNPVLRQAKGSR